MGYGRRRNEGRGKSSGGGDWEKIASVSLWEQEEGASSKAPVLTGTIEYEDGRKVSISLWESESDHENAPVLYGSVTKKVAGSDGGSRRRRSRPEHDEDFD